MDLLLVEEGNGGDLKLNGNDLALMLGWGNMPYLALFGGNVRAVTKEKLATEQAYDWWGNNLLFPSNTSVQFNSETEKKLNEIALNSKGRAEIEQVVRRDLDFMKAFADIEVKAEIISTDHLKITIKVKQPDSLEGRIPDAFKSFVFIWDATKKLLGDFYELDFDTETDFY